VAACLAHLWVSRLAGMLAGRTSSLSPRPQCLAWPLLLGCLLGRPGSLGLVGRLAIPSLLAMTSLLGLQKLAWRSGAGWAALMPSRPWRR